VKLFAALALVLMTAPLASASTVAHAATLPSAPDPNAPGATIGDDGIISDGVDVVERLGEQVAVDVPLTNQDGKTVRLSDYLGKGKPVMLAMVYYRCPVLCGLIMQGMAKSLSQIDWLPGKDFEVLTVSIDPNETSDLAKEKRRGFIQAIGKEVPKDAWPFFTAGEQATNTLAASLGFKFKYVERERQFAHVAVLFFIAPDGTITRYLYGVNYDPKEVKLALFESAHGKVGTAFERVMMRCYKFDASARKYMSFVRLYYRIWGAIIVLVLGTFLAVLWRRDYLRSRPVVAKGKDNA
jgi:protein SCO1/2